MTRFVLVFAAVYGGMHAYLLWQGRRSFALGPVATALVGLLFLVMVAAPVVTRLLDRQELVSMARPLGYVGYSWMAAAFWLFLLCAGRDLWNLAAAGAGWLVPGAARLAVPLRGSAFLFLAAVALAGLWGLREAWDIRLHEVTVRTPHLPAGSRPVRIAFISDVHVGLLTGERKLRKIAQIVEAARPDLLISGGDLVDGSAEHLDHVSRILAEIPAPLGKFAVTGNHEYYAGIEQSEAFTERAGFRLLHGEAVNIDGRLLVAGVDDPAAGQFRLASEPGEDELLPRGSDRSAVVLVKHRPAPSAGSLGRFDLQLSGHTHGGQIYPFRYFVALSYPLLDGLTEVGEGSYLYKGKGTGTWGPPIRFLAPPEVTLVVLRPEDNDPLDISDTETARFGR